MNEHEVIIRGGLGNQLFCLFHAYKLSLIYKQTVSLNLTHYQFVKIKDRSFVLDSLYPPILEEFNFSSNKLSKALFFFSKYFEKFFVKSKSNFLPGDNPFFLNYWKNRYIHSGYFQKINESEIDKKCLDLIKNKLKPFIFQNGSNYLAIHIRRGDYLNNKHLIHGVIDEKYFIEEAINEIRKNKYEGIKIFSDSPNLIDKNIFKKLHENIIIDQGGKSIDVFKRMANNKGLIASNSSFSLWAGILGDIQHFSIPFYWMKNVKSSLIGLEKIKRYKCFI